MIRSPAIRRAARGEACTLAVAGICNGNPETTVFAHFRWLGECGTGIKPSDVTGAFCCSSCHDWLDGRSNLTIEYLRGDYQGDRNFYALRGMVRTMTRLVEMGVVKIEGVKV